MTNDDRNPVWGVPTWVAAGEGHLAAWVHLPADGLCTGATVLVPAADREQVISYRAWHVLARELARAGQAVVRFALRGDGDSDALIGDDVAASWQADLDAAIDLASELVPGVPVTLLGLRIGGAIAAASKHPAVGQVICWEPASGLEHLAPGSGLDGGIELDGEWYSAERAASIRALEVIPRAGLEIVLEDDREVADRLFVLSCRHGLLPRASIARLVARVPGAEPRPVTDWQPVGSSVRTIEGVEVVERFVEVGPHRLPGIVTEPAGGATGHAIAWYSGGSEPKDGPTGLWADCARRAAVAGHASLRVERQGTGDALDEHEDAQPLPYRESSVHDTVDAVRLLRTLAPGDAVVVGLSATAWQAARAAALVPIDRIVMVNTIGWRPKAAAYKDLFREPLRQRIAARLGHAPSAPVALPSVRTVQAGTVPTTRIEGPGPLTWLKKLPGRAVGAVRDGLPDAPYRLLGRLDLVMEPGLLLGPILSGTQVCICLGEWEMGFWLRARGPQVAQRLGHLDVRVVLAALDHALVRRDARNFVLEHVVDLVEGRLGERP